MMASASEHLQRQWHASEQRQDAERECDVVAIGIAQPDGRRRTKGERESISAERSSR
jgi:hypothetical protein